MQAESVLFDKEASLKKVLNYIDEWRIINSLPEVAPAEEYSCSFASETCEYEKLTNRFSIYVTKISFLDSEKEADDANRIVTIRFSNLWEMKWHKKS